jgi:hypothetical protein
MICKVNDACAACPDNATASCPMFIWSMSFDQLVAWMRSEMKDQGITHQKLSDLSGIPKNTIDTILAGRQRDIGHYVLSSLVRVLMRRSLASSPCRAAALAAKVTEMSAKDEVIADLRAQLKESRETNATHRGTIADLRSQVKKLEAAAKKAQK